MAIFNLFQSSTSKWEKILSQPIDKQSKFLNKVCKVNQRDELVIREFFFDNLSFSLIKKIAKLVKNVVNIGGMDESFQEIILDRLLGVSEVSDLYIEDKEVENNIIQGEGYFVYTACYNDIDLIIDFINTHDDINSICDLGSGSGRVLLYMALKINRDMEFRGLELINDRVEFTNSIVSKFSLNNISFKTCNFLKNPEQFLGFDAYYLFDPVGTDDVPLLTTYFEKMIKDGKKFYILFISGWDDLMQNSLNNLDNLEKIDSIDSHKQEDRYISFYKVL